MNSNSFIKKVGNGLKLKIVSLFHNRYKAVNISWIKLKYYKHLPAGKLRTHYLFGKPLFFYNPEELLHALDEIFIDQCYKQELQDQPYIIDCGANIGLSIIYMKNCYPAAEIIAFEPDTKNFDLLQRNIRAFSYAGVTLRKEAIWTTNTILMFSGEGSMSSKITSEQNNNTSEVKATRLRDLLTREVDFLKIDIEGAEFEVLNDIFDRLYYVKNMFIEYHGAFKQNSQMAQLLTLVNNAGFNFYIKEAACIFKTPFYRTQNDKKPYDIQLNIYCFRV